MTDVSRAVFYAPHPDDETLSMGLAMITFIAVGYDVHLVSMNKGGNGGPLGSFNGDNACNWSGEHPYTHNPSREGYTAHTATSLATARFLEARAALGAMATVTPSPGITLGNIYHHDGGLPDAFGNTPTAVADAQAVIASYVQDLPNSFHYTMSPTDDHPDHAACGQALRNLKTVDPSLANARFFVSRLYWATSQPNGQYPADVAAQPDLAWFNAGTRKAEFDAILRGRVVKAFNSWNPACGSYAIGYHQVVNQFLNNFGATVSIGNLWHA